MTKHDIAALATIMRIAKKHREVYPKGDVLIVVENEIANYCYRDGANVDREVFLDDCVGPVGERVSWSEWT